MKGAGSCRGLQGLGVAAGNEVLGRMTGRGVWRVCRGVGTEIISCVGAYLRDSGREGGKEVTVHDAAQEDEVVMNALETGCPECDSLSGM